MHDLGDALVRAGFSDPVIDAQVLTITYDNFDKLAQDLRHSGSANATDARNRGLTGRTAGERLRAACLAQAGPDGRFPITIEAVFAVAWASGPTLSRSTDGEFEFPGRLSSITPVNGAAAPVQRAG